jgi:type IV pilus assembly protein PilQ
MSSSDSFTGGRFFRHLAATLALVAGSTVALAQTSTPQTPEPDSSASRVSVDENLVVDLHVNDDDLANVLEMLSIQSQKNIVASKDVSARVTANLYGVTFYEALDAILHVNGYGYVERGNFIFVYTRQELETLAAAERERVHKVLTLNYLNAIDAAEFVTPLLSTDGGTIKTNGRAAAFPSLSDAPVGAEDYALGSMIVVYDFPENVQAIEALLRQIDTKPAQVLVESTILQTELNEANAFGVDFSIIADINFADFVQVGGPTQAANALIGGRSSPGGSNPFPADAGGSAVSSTVGGTAGPGGLKLGIVSNDVSVFLRVLDEVSDTTVISNPKLLTLNRMPARVLVGRKVGYLSTTSTDTATTQTVEFLDTGTQLSVRPFVTNDGLIRMELRPQVSEAFIREARDASGAAVTIPDEVTNELTTNVIVRDGQTVVLGGLFRESTKSSRRQVPFLGDIPILGQAFRGTDDDVVRNEIIFLITPTIVNDSMLEAQGQRSEAFINHVRTGAREGLMRWSRERLTSSLNIQAERLAEQGQTEEAIHRVQRSLWLNRNQPEAVALRERLTGQTSNWPDRMNLNDLIRGEVRGRTQSSVPRAPPPAARPAPPPLHPHLRLDPQRLGSVGLRAEQRELHRAGARRNSEPLALQHPPGRARVPPDQQEARAAHGGHQPHRRRHRGLPGDVGDLRGAHRPEAHSPEHARHCSGLERSTLLQ